MFLKFFDMLGKIIRNYVASAEVLILLSMVKWKDPIKVGLEQSITTFKNKFIQEFI